jgi:N-hydroxyarylamine O-acetyltransferase
MPFQFYLRALELDAPSSPNLQFLTELTKRHCGTFTFNSLGVLLQEDLPLDNESLIHKLVGRNAGGYCFEHNKLTFDLLTHLGFNTRLVLGRVLNNVVHPVPRTHRITLVELESEWFLVDVGFGGNCPTTPIKLHSDALQTSGMDQYRVRALPNNEYELVLMKDGESFILYRFDLADYSDADCELGHFYSHKHPNAVFVNNLVVSRKETHDYCVITNHLFQHRQPHQTRHTEIDSADTLHTLLTNVFGLSIDREVCQFLFNRFIVPKLKASKNLAVDKSGVAP